MIPERYQLAHTLYPYAPVADQEASDPARHPVVIVGGGPVGLALALDLGLRGTPALVLDDHEGAGQGSRALCFAKRTLEIVDRLGAADAMLDKGVVWNRGRVFREDREIYDFNLLPEAGHKIPAFINLQQPYFEKFLVERIRQAQDQGAPIEIRGRNLVTALDARDNDVELEIKTPDGSYTVIADRVVACDGARSPIRGMMGLSFDGRVFEDNFLIADVTMQADFPTERWFWFNPDFHRDQSVLLHKQPDGVWRIDFQLGWDIDRAEVVKPENVRPMVAAMLGPDVDFELEWVSVYTFQCCSMENYRHGRVFFAGDAAHQVSPFGARGANGGVQDADNLGWKLAMVAAGDAPEALLDSYHVERKYAADENILNSTRATDFLTPKTPVSKMFREAVLDLAEKAPFARPIVNSGRLSAPATLDHSPLNGPDDPSLPSRTRPGAPAPDAPVADGWLLGMLGGGFSLLAVNCDGPKIAGVSNLYVDASDAPEVAERYLGDASAALYLIRPDQHVAARWTTADAVTITTALDQACGRTA